MSSTVAPTSPSPPATDRAVHGISGWRRAVLVPLGLLIRAWTASLRIEADAATLIHTHRYAGRPMVYVLWHNRLFAIAEMARRFGDGQPVHALISASRDGAWLAAFFSVVGIRAVRGSSSRLGREAVSQLVQTLQCGHDVGITPDGPRGPRYDFKSGAIIVARRARADFFLSGQQFEDAWMLPSWDGFYIPKPFSRVRFFGRRIPAEEIASDEFTAESLRAELMRINPDERATFTVV